MNGQERAWELDKVWWAGDEFRIWSTAVARLADFIADFPPSPNETHVFQYHEIVKILEDASRQDLSGFRIAPDRINSRGDNKKRECWQIPLAVGSAVEHSYFCNQVRGLMDHVKAVLDASCAHRFDSVPR